MSGHIELAAEVLERADLFTGRSLSPREQAWALAEAGLLRTPEDDAVLAAAQAHHPRTEHLLNYDCWSGNCDDPEHAEAGECPAHPAVVCAACMDLAMELNDEYVPNEVLASSCPVCLAVMKVAAATGGPL